MTIYSWFRAEGKPRPSKIQKIQNFIDTYKTSLLVDFLPILKNTSHRSSQTVESNVNAEDSPLVQSLGACPKCGSAVYSHDEIAYICERSAGPGRKCDFRIGKIILQRPIEAEQVQKLLTAGKTDLLHRFLSAKGQSLSAFLVRGNDGNLSFEFAPHIPNKGSLGK